MVFSPAQHCLRLSPLLGLLLGVALEPAQAQTLTPSVQSQLARWYRSASRGASGTWGIAIANQQGDLLWSVRPNQPMIPASTVKLLTTGFARTVLGGDARLATRVVGEGSLVAETGEWRGNWALELNGDPSLERPTRGGPTLSELAWQLADRGIRKLYGPLHVTSANGPANVVYPEAWSPHHWGRVFAPLIGPITLNENVVYLTIRPGTKLGTKARLVSTVPQGLDALVTIHAQTWKGARSRLALRRMADGGWLITGSIGINALPRRMTSVAGNPKAVLAETWAKALHEAGIVWDRTPESSVVAPVPTVDGFDQVPDRPRHKQDVLAEVTSAPFDSLASEINRRSLNIGAELLLQWAAGRDDAAEQLTQHVQEVTGLQDGIHLVDGSGLSAEDRLTPATFVHYLARFPETPAGRNFAQLLPANGVGTLRPIAWGLPEPGVVHAKTGTLGGVSTLVGYLGRRDGVLLISVMYNGGRARTAKRAQWNLFRLLGADGVTIPADTTDTQGDEDSADDSDQLGGEGQ